MHAQPRAPAEMLGLLMLGLLMLDLLMLGLLMLQALTRADCAKQGMRTRNHSAKRAPGHTLFISITAFNRHHWQHCLAAVPPSEAAGCPAGHAQHARCRRAGLSLRQASSRARALPPRQHHGCKARRAEGR